MTYEVFKCILLFTFIELGFVFAAIVDDSRDDEHPQGLSENSRHAWRLVIYPQPHQNLNILVKRVDDTLNLTCKVEFFETEKDSNRTLVEERFSQSYRLSWYLPFVLESSKNRVTTDNSDSHNSLQLVVEKLKETDTGEYKCQTESLSEPFTSSRYTHVASVNLRVKPKKGSCSDPMFSCSSGECIAKRYLCDGKGDCKGHDDESHQQCGTYNPCEGKLLCEDGRCISSNWCCDRQVDKNCTVKAIPKCCLQLQSIQVNLDVSQFSSQPQHYNDMGFLQTTIYTVIGCAMAFMFIITIMVIAICRVHLKRTALARYPHHLAHSGDRQSSWGNIFFHSPAGFPCTSTTSGLLVTYNINNGVQFVGNRPLNPPPYSEIMGIPPREGPPPPYASSSSPTNAFHSVGCTRTESNCCRRSEYLNQNPTTSNVEPAAHEPLIQNDNNNGDINGNNTEAILVQPNRNTS